MRRSNVEPSGLLGRARGSAGGKTRRSIPRNGSVEKGFCRDSPHGSLIGDISKQDLRTKIEQFIAYFTATMAKPFRWTMTDKPLTA
jgi:hypothetical protein